MKRFIPFVTVAFLCVQAARLLAAEAPPLITFGDSVTAPRGGVAVAMDLLANDLSYDGKAPEGRGGRLLLPQPMAAQVNQTDSHSM